MEVMSSLLLCALVALLPQTQGNHRMNDITFKYNNSLLINQKAKHKLLLNLNAPPLVVRVSELQAVFNDYACIKCLECMERAIKAYKLQNKYQSSRLTSEELHNDIIPNFISGRTKRDVDTNVKNESKKEKKNKKTKVHKAVTVTKYNMNGDVYALRVKESPGVSEENKAPVTSCVVYSVKKSFPCDSPEGFLILAAENTKLNKKNKKNEEKSKTIAKTTTEKPKTRLSYRKRQVDNTQIPENIMPSMEEFERE